MRTGRTAIALCALSALAVAIYFTFKYENRVYTATTLAVIPVAWSILLVTYKYWSKGRGSDQSETSTPEQAAAAADWLAGAVAGSWRKEAVARRIVTPAPVSVRWRWASGDWMTLPPREAGQLPAPGAGPPTLPDLGQPDDPVLTSGVVTKLHDELYARLPRGRLVITGGPGSGKTGAMILLLLEALAWREKLAPGKRSQVPVPVLLTLGGWDPASVPLSAWAASVLNRDYRALRASRYGSDAASALITSGRVALFLDGLDEMPENLRVAALQQVNAEVPGLRLVVTSRPTEYAEAIRKTPLESSAVIELRPVRPAAAAAFLVREQPERNRAAWQEVADYIKANPCSGPAKALDNPLTLTMARDAYSTGNPVDIIDPSSFPDEDEIASRLIGQFLIRTYPGRRARRWLGHLARYLNGLGGNGLQDLEWWQLGGMLNPATRILAVALAASAAGVLVDWAVTVPLDLFLFTVPGQLKYALFDGLMIGVLVGAVFGFGYAIVIISGKAKFEPSPVPLRLPGRRAVARALRLQDHVARTASGFLIGFAGGLGNAVVEALEERLFFGTSILSNGEIRETLIRMPFFGTLFGLASAMAFFTVSILEEPSTADTAATPFSLLAESRSRALFQAAIIAPLPAVVIAAGGWIASDRLQAFPGPPSWSLAYALITGIVAGVSGTISYTLAFTTWGQWLLLARAALPLTGRLPWALTGFLNDAYNRGVLRQAGAVYQFRHVTLQAYLSRRPQNDADQE